MVIEIMEEDIMPTDLFNSLKEEKKSAVINAALEEFGSFGVINASTNNIVKRCGISKGSLFKYFETKDELCFYLFELVTNEMLGDLTNKMQDFSSEIFQKIIDYSVWETSWYIDNPVKGRFIIAVAGEKDSAFVEKLQTRFGAKSDNVYLNLMSELNMENFNVDANTLSNLIKWTVEGYNKEFLGGINMNKSSLQELKDEYMNGLVVYIDSIKKGVLK